VRGQSLGRGQVLADGVNAQRDCVQHPIDPVRELADALGVDILLENAADEVLDQFTTYLPARFTPMAVVEHTRGLALQYTSTYNVEGTMHKLLRVIALSFIIAGGGLTLSTEVVAQG